MQDATTSESVNPLNESLAENSTTVAATDTMAERGTVNDEKSPKWLVQNQCGSRIKIKSIDKKSEFTLAPLAKIKMTEKELALYDMREWEHHNLLWKVKEDTTLVVDKLSEYLPGLFVIIFVSGTFLRGFFKELSIAYYLIVMASLTIILLLVLTVFVVGTKDFWRPLKLLINETFTLVLVLGTGIGVPFIVIFDGSRSSITLPLTWEVLSRLLQFTFIAIVSLLPALLYFLFDRQRLGTLRQRFYRQVLRLDPNLKTLHDVWAKYGEELDEVYGAERSFIGRRIQSGTRWPIVITTVVITLGWLLTLKPATTGGIIDKSSYEGLFQPRQISISFGFLGSYYFALNMILRRYVRGDLRPKAYSSITVRVFAIIILAWMLDVTTIDNSVRLLLVFIAGIIPETAITLILEYIRKFQSSFQWGRLSIDPLPLTNLEGIDLYDRSRLMDEGVTNIQSLAHHDLIDLLLQTRIPTPRLVDWVDQAILYLHVQDAKVGVEAKNGNEISELYQALRKYGIRTATDLENVCSVQNSHSSMEENLVQSLQASGGEELVKRLEVVLKTIKNAEWLNYIRNWRNSSELGRETIEDPNIAYLPEVKSIP